MCWEKMPEETHMYRTNGWLVTFWEKRLWESKEKRDICGGKRENTRQSWH
jgi:hypothetical protein